MSKSLYFRIKCASSANSGGGCFFLYWHIQRGCSMPQRPQKRNCSACYFSRPFDGTLHCLRNPPAIEPDTGCACWPIVKQTDICGRFRFTSQDHIHSDHWPKNALPIYTDRLGDYCRIPLTQGKFAKIDPEDYIWLAQFRWHCKINKNSIYAVRSITISGRTKRIYMHRLIVNTPSHLLCDHINHNGLDNRKANLRNCTIKQNNANSRSAQSASSKYKGVSWNKRRKKWSAYIKKDGIQLNLGSFDNQIDAAKAYDKAAKKLHGQFAALNFANNQS